MLFTKLFFCDNVILSFVKSLFLCLKIKHRVCASNCAVFLNASYICFSSPWSSIILAASSPSSKLLPKTDISKNSLVS